MSMARSFRARIVFAGIVGSVYGTFYGLYVTPYLWGIRHAEDAPQILLFLRYSPAGKLSAFLWLPIVAGALCGLGSWAQQERRPALLALQAGGAFAGCLLCQWLALSVFSAA